MGREFVMSQLYHPFVAHELSSITCWCSTLRMNKQPFPVVVHNIASEFFAWKFNLLSY